MRKKIVILLMALLITGFGCKQSATPSAVETIKKDKTNDKVIQENLEIETKLQEIKKTDADVDGLSDEEEKRLGTKSDSADSDSDGLLDIDEVRTHKTDPLKADTDGDGKSDGYEVRRGQNPLKK